MVIQLILFLHDFTVGGICLPTPSLYPMLSNMKTRKKCSTITKQINNNS